MKLFRRFKYRLRRFIISLISVFCLCSVFIVSASAEVLPVSDYPLSVKARPYAWINNEWVYDEYYSFMPGSEITTHFPIVDNDPFGLTFDVLTSEGATHNAISVKEGTLHFHISFLTDQYFTSRIPYINLSRWEYDSELNEDTSHGYTVLSENFTYNSNCVQYSGSGSNKIFKFTCDIYVDSQYLPVFDFAQFYFYLQRDSASAYRDNWYIKCQSFICEILTSADVPKYNKPDDTAKNELDSVEGELKGNIDSFGSDIGSIFSFDDLYDLVVPGITFWGTTLEDFFNLDFVRPILILSLACGIFALLFGLVGTLVARSNFKQSQSKSSKSKGG